jgi:hypothetical protein
MMSKNKAVVRYFGSCDNGDGDSQGYMKDPGDK